jgi:hypothetical protein
MQNYNFSIQYSGFGIQVSGAGVQQKLKIYI